MIHVRYSTIAFKLQNEQRETEENANPSENRRQGHSEAQEEGRALDSSDRRQEAAVVTQEALCKHHTRHRGSEHDQG